MTPPAELAPPPVAPAPMYKLHSPEQVALASFLGTPLAGAWLMALNERRAGSKAAFRRTVALGLLFTAVAMVIGVGLGMVLPKFPNYGLPFAYVLAMRGWATRAQGPMLAAHFVAKGAKASAWGAVGAGLLCLVVVLAVLAGILVAGPDSLSDRYEVAKDQAIEYQDGATRADAAKVGDALKAAGVLTGSHPMDLKLARQKSGFALSFVVEAENAAKPEMQRAFQDVGAKVKAVLNENVEVHLCEDDWTPRVKLQAP